MLIYLNLINLFSGYMHDELCIFFFFFNSQFHLYGYCLLPVPPLFSPFLNFARFPFFSVFPDRDPPLEHVTAAILSYAFARGNSKIAEKLCRYSRLFHRIRPQSTVSEKMTYHSSFRYAGRGPAITHLSSDSGPSFFFFFFFFL